MPSICEVPVSEKSWVAPELRSRGSPQPRRRRKTPERPAENERETGRDGYAPIASKAPTHQNEVVTRALRSVTMKIIQVVVSSAFAVAILHLLVLPEFVYEHQELCAKSIVPKLYSASCPQYNMSEASISSRYEAVLASQTRLESLFNSTLKEMTPLRNTLRQSDFMLHDIQKQLKKSYPGTKHELALEFDGCWQSIRAAAGKFNTLNVDIQSAVDSLLATGVLNRKPSRAQVAKDDRLSAQMLRRKQYVDQLTSRMRSKADALSSDLTTLDDHLESIEHIVDRERKQKATSDFGSDFGSDLLPTFLFDLRDKVSSFIQSAAHSDSSAPDPAFKLFQEAVKHHQPVAEMVRSLSSQLQVLQMLKDFT